MQIAARGTLATEGAGVGNTTLSRGGRPEREHGVFPTAKALHLEYGKLEQLGDTPVPALKGRVAKAPTPVQSFPLNFASRSAGIISSAYSTRT